VRSDAGLHLDGIRRQSDATTESQLVPLGRGGTRHVGAAATFPLVRPFYDDLARDPTDAAQTISSLRWVVAHLMLIAALVLLPFSLLTVFADLTSSHGRRLAFVGMVLCMAGAGLYLPVGGVDAFALPGIARSYLQGQTGTLDLIDAARSGCARRCSRQAFCFSALAESSLQWRCGGRHGCPDGPGVRWRSGSCFSCRFSPRLFASSTAC
jgi:hypothetical protein